MLLVSVLSKNCLLPKEIGRLLKHAETFRYVADYESESVDESDAQKMVQQADNFVAMLQAKFMQKDSN